MLIGAHISTSGGYDKMTDYYEQVACECAQIFAKSPRMWNQKPLDQKQIDSMKALRESGRLGPLFTHTSYLINLTTNNEELWEKSVHALADELKRGSDLGCAGVNTHLGSVPDKDVEAATQRAARGIERAFEIAGGEEAVNTALVIENTAGAGTLFGGPVNDIAQVILSTNIDRSKLGLCIDSCHAWAYGYDVSVAEGWHEIAQEIEDTVGLDRWVLTHANDCKFGRGSKKDRHEWIGRGEIGLAGFQELFNLNGMDHLCLVTEMPGKVPEKDIVNNEVLRELREKAQ